jgi:peptide/nickel transport system permease protein
MTEASEPNLLNDGLQEPERPARTPLQESWHILRRNRLAMLGMVMFLLFLLTSIFGAIVTSGRNPWMDPSTVRMPERFRPPLTRYNADEVPAEEAPPFGMYVLGTDHLGRDVLSRMLQGSWVSLTIGFVAVSISVGIGIFLGGLAGYFGKWTDTIIMRFVDTMLCIPRFFLILIVIALAGGGIFKIMIVIGLTSWMGTTRFVRAEFLSLRERDFVQAARALGVGNMRIIFWHMIPNAVAPVLVSATLGIAGTILLEASLSFLGFGVPPPHATWGKILSNGQSFIFDALWLTLIPGLAILVVVLSFNLFGEGLRDAFNPKLRGRGA